MKVARVSYRVRQFWRAARLQPSSRDKILVQTILTPAQMALFFQMQPAEQAHSLHVARALIEKGETDSDLLKAALLHDVGKICYPLKLWERAWIVLGNAYFPGLVSKWGAALQDGEAISVLRRPFVVAAQHPDWGARLALKTGVSTLTAHLIRRHQSRPKTNPALSGVSSAEDRLLRLLQSVDDES